MPFIITIRNEVAKVMFYTCLSFCPTGGSASVHAGIPPPPMSRPPRSRPPLSRPPPKQLLLRTVRILLECILVQTKFRFEMGLQSEIAFAFTFANSKIGSLQHCFFISNQNPESRFTLYESQLESGAAFRNPTTY